MVTTIAPTQATESLIHPHCVAGAPAIRLICQLTHTQRRDDREVNVEVPIGIAGSTRSLGLFVSKILEDTWIVLSVRAAV